MKAVSYLPWVVYAGFVILVSLWMGQQSHGWLPPQATAESVLIDDLFGFLVTLGTIIFLGVFGVLATAILTSQVSRFDLDDGPPIEGNVTLEIVWTVIPVLLVTWIAATSFNVYNQMSIQGPMEVVHLHHLGMEPAYAATLDETGQPIEDIEVNAKQWVWTFHYPKQNVTSTELHVPVDRRVRLALYSEDVLHGFFVPAFRLKQDILPKRTIDLEFTPILEGKYRLEDSQFSGTYFAAMQADVLVESAATYQDWLKRAAAAKPTPAFNQAYSEYYRGEPDKPVEVGWASVPPAKPPMVNQPTPQGIDKEVPDKKGIEKDMEQGNGE
ncbi:cytochrome c oxidase subunit II [Stenomitos frigidus]|uniref:Cytochrome c oxidase subunit 2 n=1 Tax=Stenomitos frigidus ULC18 TaxID=2107698 RepID=A0A2T1DXE5_9CYAN|nr:cytochrome c oxidase subunit II [Stenomitos frigidus]PSB25111.1 cytochrome C oxidase subunit II [Stenomitos frigidus ULC18]